MTSPSTNVRSPADHGPYVLRPWVDSVPLSDGSQDEVKINCVEYYDGNLYVGTSASELLHFVRIPPDPSDPSARPVFIPASRLTPVFSQNTHSRPGVQQILLLPRVGKACILCNRTVTFYSLPELTPSGTREVNNCNWIGGVDLNEADAGGENSSVIILLSTKRRIQVVKIEDGVRAIKNIDFAGSTLSVRRDSIACVADSKTYALIDVDRQLKIPLMSISSLEDGPSISQSQTVEDTQSTAGPRQASGRGSPGESMSSSPPPESQRADGASRPSTPQQAPVETQTPPVDKPLPPAPKPALLKPHIASPTNEEFLLVMGTSPVEPGVGMFINLDGDPTRPTITFSQYPTEIVVDGNANHAASPSPVQEEEGYVLASMAKEVDGSPRYGIEIQRWDAGSEAHPEVHWLMAGEATDAYGIRTLTSSQEMCFEEIVEQLSLCRFTPFPSAVEAAPALKPSDSRTELSMERVARERELFERAHEGEPLPAGWEAARSREGEEFARRLATTRTRLAVWSADRIWWAVRNPLIVQLDARLEACSGQEMDKSGIMAVLAAVEGDAKSELEFTTFGYIQQKAGILVMQLLLSAGEPCSEEELVALEQVLVSSKLDPRVVLSLMPGIRNEILEGRRGIWVYGGVKAAAEGVLGSEAFQRRAVGGIQGVEVRTLHFLRRYLQAWRRMKGFGSVLAEDEVFCTVEAALLVVLLELDKHSQGRGGVRAELNALVDGGMADSFERAVGLLQAYQRLFVLSRLYQSRKMAAEVLATWRRMVEGENEGEELKDGEQRVREYLARLSNVELVKEYGVWLARRNPRLGVQVFAEGGKRGGKIRFEPGEVVELLRREAPNAVRHYLEYLVLGRGRGEYVDELIGYHLDVVVRDLEEPGRREAVLKAYEEYRGLPGPKMTYRHFLLERGNNSGNKNGSNDDKDDNSDMDNNESNKNNSNNTADKVDDNDDAGESRLRLLQLLASSHTYDIPAIRSRLANLEDLLVPESIILSGRERRHDDALRLVVHKLGDYDTAVSYCLRGGASIYSSTKDIGGDNMRDDGPDKIRHLFSVLLREFLAIDDVSDRVQQTAALLNNFGSWFELHQVLSVVPDSWSAAILARFLVGAVRRLVMERREGGVVRALCGGENLRVAYDLVKMTEPMLDSK